MSKHKMIFLIAPPRSLSTAFLRMMQARGDFQIFNEPATAWFNQTHYPNSAAFYESLEPGGYKAIKETLFKALEKGAVFVKEMSFAFEALITEEPDILNYPNLHFAFILRNPHHCIISYYQKLPKDYLDYMVPQLNNLCAHKPLFHSFEKVRAAAVHAPVIIQAEDLVHHTQQTVEAFCQQMGINFKEASLNWESLGSNFEGQIWKENKKQELAYHWHGEAILSKGFHQPKTYALDDRKYPSFTEIDNVAHRAICRAVYEDYLKYYQVISAFAASESLSID